MKRGWLILILISSGCQSALQAGGMGGSAGGGDDPLAVDSPALSGSLDELYRTVVYPSCASQAGACHAGQFEPNLSTPGLLYANLVLRPSLEHEGKLRVKPGDPDHSLLVDKLRNRNVATQMPLGAKPLSEDKIALFESWIRGGALRAPGAEPAPLLNNAPEPPEVAIFDGPGANAHRLDAGGQLQVQPGDTLVLRHSVHDFETPDAQMAYAGFILYTGDGSQLVIDPADTQSPYFGYAQFDAAAPSGTRRALPYRFSWTVPAMVGVMDPAGTTLQKPTTGMSLTVLAYYADQSDADGISTYKLVNDLVQVK